MRRGRLSRAGLHRWTQLKGSGGQPVGGAVLSNSSPRTAGGPRTATGLDLSATTHGDRLQARRRVGDGYLGLLSIAPNQRKHHARRNFLRALRSHGGPKSSPFGRSRLRREQMRKLLLFLFALCSLGSAQEKAVEENYQPALTIYNQNFFVARE